MSGRNSQEIKNCDPILWPPGTQSTQIKVKKKKISLDSPISGYASLCLGFLEDFCLAKSFYMIKYAWLLVSPIHFYFKLLLYFYIVDCNTFGHFILFSFTSIRVNENDFSWFLKRKATKYFYQF